MKFIFHLVMTEPSQVQEEEEEQHIDKKQKTEEKKESNPLSAVQYVSVVFLGTLERVDIPTDLFDTINSQREKDETFYYRLGIAHNNRCYWWKLDLDDSGDPLMLPAWDECSAHYLVREDQDLPRV